MKEENLFDLFNDSNGFVEEGFDRQLQKKEEESEAVKKVLFKCKMHCIREEYSKAKELAEELLEADFRNANAYIAYLRAVSLNFTVKQRNEEIDIYLALIDRYLKNKEVFDEDYLKYRKQVRR